MGSGSVNRFGTQFLNPIFVFYFFSLVVIFRVFLGKVKTTLSVTCLQGFSVCTVLQTISNQNRTALLEH